jgi:hypothetical protein
MRLAQFQEADNIFLTGWIVINLLTVVGLFGSYAAIKYYYLDQAVVRHSFLFHAVILLDCTFLILSVFFIAILTLTSSSMIRKPNEMDFNTTNTELQANRVCIVTNRTGDSTNIYFIPTQP